MGIVDNALVGASGSSGYQLQRSLRFRASASAYLNRTPASAGNRKTYTWSGWLKRGVMSAYSGIFGAWYGAGTGNNTIHFTNTDNIRFYDYTGLGFNYDLVTTQVFRDPSAWYHLVVAVDTTQATASNRIKIYINGSQVTSFSTASYPTQNSDGYINSTNAHYVSYFAGFGYYFDGYLAEVNFIDGQALTPSSFGSTNSVTGVWQPARYTGTYGTNGFYLPFSDNTSATTLAYDKSGNGNNWTANNISTTAGATYDSMTDVPTLTSATAANFATLNPLDVLSSASVRTISNGNLDCSLSGNWNGGATIAVSSGAYYCELTPTSNFDAALGIDDTLGNVATFYRKDGTRWNGSAWVAYGAAYTTNDIIGMAFDKTNATVTFYKNNVSQGQITSVAFSSLARPFFYGVSGLTFNVNFGQRPFSYTPPTGFKALNTFNLPDPTIKKPNQYMDATLYTGNSSTQTVVNAGGFQPDLVWVKNRSVAGQHVLTDSVRGTNFQLFSSLTNAEQNSSTGLTAFNSNGFSLGANPSPTGSMNSSSDSFVGWQWKESATAGFDIVTYTGNGTAGRTVNHSLGVAPSMIIVKGRSNADNWQVGHTSVGWNGFLYFNLTNAYTATSSAWNNTAPTSTVFSLGSDTRSNGSGTTYVAYLFAEIAGFSKFGSYTGNGSADGPFVYCGFRPKYVMTKRTDTTNDWAVIDTSRSAYNVSSAVLFPDLSDAETASGNLTIDVISNGFKIRSTSTNANGGTYIFAAFAETPFRYSLAR